MNVPQRLQRSRQAGAKHGNCRSVVRGTKYGNDYEIKMIDKRLQIGYVINRKTGYHSRQISGEAALHKHAVEMHKIQMEENLKSDSAYYDDLFNYDFISCFCPLNLACHCDVLIEHLQKRLQELTA